MEAAFFAENRRRLREAMGGGIFVCHSGLPRRRSADEDYCFYVNRNFLYLTGLDQEDLVYMAWAAEDGFRETLFLPETDPMTERWFGRRYRPEEAADRSGISDTAPRSSFPEAFHRLVSGETCPAVWLDFDGAETGPVSLSDYPWCRPRNAHPLLSRLRTLKTPAEVAQLRESIALTDRGIRAMLAACGPGLYEYQLRAVFEQVLSHGGDHEPAFPSIVAAGPNTLVLHYPEQDRQIRDGDLILVDVGAQLGLLGADISRVFPANGRFSPRQRALTQAAVEAIDELCKLIKPGMAMTDIDLRTSELVFERLLPLGLVRELSDAEQYLWHSTSHHLGLDTHDECDYAMPIAPGMVFTMEVGIYVEEWGFGVRMEDDILMTEAGCENLSAAIPRTVEALEAAMKKGGM